MKKRIMVRAWTIAKNAVIKFGGKASQYLSAAMKQAWGEVKISPVSCNPTIESLNDSGKIPYLIGEKMPTLAGSEKQIAWADSIRSKFNTTFNNLALYLERNKMPASEVRKIVKMGRFLIDNRTNASFWIDQRENIGIVQTTKSVLLTVAAEFKAATGY